MKVLVDAPVWSLSLRRQTAKLNAEEVRLMKHLAELVRENRAEILGAVRQELLSGIRDSSQFERVRLDLREYEDVPLSMEDYEEAARVANGCRASGVAGSPVDYLICAAALRRRWEIFTTDQDFHRYARVTGISLFPPAMLH